MLAQAVLPGMKKEGWKNYKYNKRGFSLQRS